MNKPLICIPLLGASFIDMYEQYDMLDHEHFDLIEIRIDYYKNLNDRNALMNFIEKCRELEISKPIIMTYRSIEEGGLGNLNNEDYESLIQYLCTVDYVDYIDIEYGHPSFNKLVKECKEHKQIVASKHYFKSTPPIEDNIDVLTSMDALGVTIAKIAMMPQNNDDVLSILQLASHGNKVCNCNIVVIGMGKIGITTRLMAGQFGSLITFASGVNSSAPGQISYLNMSRLINETYL